MKIATWNIERLSKSTTKTPLIIGWLERMDADILILTETTTSIELKGDYHFFCTSRYGENYFRDDERRVAIYSKYPMIEQLKTFRGDTSLCIIVQTPLGDLSVYGTIVGVRGNRQNDFIEDLDQQILDYQTIAQKGALCIAGDLNMSFEDNYYFTNEGRHKMINVFKRLQLINLTEAIPQNIDHIVISQFFIGNRNISISTWNTDKTLSDHIGVCVEIT